VPVSTIIRLTAATCTTGSFLPQVIKAWRTRSTRDVSVWMFALLVSGNSLWLLYRALISDLPLVVANLITLGLVATILVLKLRYGRVHFEVVDEARPVISPIAINLVDRIPNGLRSRASCG
jgi:MtN3 and saliva related transmembrane protein